MIDVPLYDATGKQTGTLPIDETRFGGRVKPDLLKQAIVMYERAGYQGTASTRGRSQVVGSTRKLYRQKGTGNARVGNRRTCIRRGGGVAFAKNKRDMSLRMPKRMRRLARDNAILVKLRSEQAAVIEGLSFQEPKTSRMAGLLRALDAGRGCLLALAEHDPNLWKSTRNIPNTEVCLVEQLNAYHVLRRKKLLLTRQAYDLLTTDRGSAGSAETQG